MSVSHPIPSMRIIPRLGERTCNKTARGEALGFRYTFLTRPRLAGRGKETIPLPPPPPHPQTRTRFPVVYFRISGWYVCVTCSMRCDAQLGTTENVTPFPSIPPLQYADVPPLARRSSCANSPNDRPRGAGASCGETGRWSGGGSERARSGPLALAHSSHAY
ncbi:hypothetical protein LY76DRAFT_176548 [Colletotrichum caudatum]|nr:hypothetical protein LY76DRAFT_176548 [Colletotrichum caudatum]